MTMSSTTCSLFQSPYLLITGVLNDISRLRVKVGDLSETVCRCAVQGKAEELSKAMTSLSDKVRCCCGSTFEVLLK